MSYEPRACDICGAEYKPWRRDQRYCSKACCKKAGNRRQAAKPPVMVAYVCKCCGETKQRRATSPNATGLCRRCGHTAKTSPPLSGADHPMWIGGERFDPIHGRWMKRKGSTYRNRARVLMEEHLGRDLERWEHVHHINGDKLDDRLENLQVLTAWEHSQLHHGTNGRWARDFDACIDCAGTKTKHVSKGRCDNCYRAMRRAA